MFRSTGFRLFSVGILTLFMFIPMFFAGQIIDDRSFHARSTINSISAEWGGQQSLTGPYLAIPIEGAVTRTVNVETFDSATRETALTPTEVLERGRNGFLYVLPDRFDVDLSTTSTERRRGIFEVPVYSARSEMQFDFVLDDLETALVESETLLWDEARLVFGLTDNRALRGDATLTIDGEEAALAPRSGTSGLPGFEARIADPRDLADFTLTLGFNGAQSLRVAPVGRATHVTLQSDWPHPSFDGSFLPDNSEISDDGFSAAWTIPHLARNLPQISRDLPEYDARDLSFGVRFYQPNDFYQKSFRAARYSLLFIGLTFLTVFLVENRTERPVHPVQYILIGLAQAIFVVMMTAFAEQIGFGSAYLVSSAATIALLTAFGATGLGLGKRTWVLSAALITIYAVLYLILQSTDYALLTGSILAFAALAGTIFATRNEQWYRPADPNRPGLLARLRESAMAPAPKPLD